MRAICTSAPLQASTRVSPGFTLFRHSSPPFGSKQAHSNSTRVRAGWCWAFICVHTMVQVPPFQYERSTVNNIFPLACLFDSLVRVSRRVETPHFLSPAWSITEEDTACPVRGAATLCPLVSPIPQLCTLVTEAIGLGPLPPRML